MNSMLNNEQKATLEKIKAVAGVLGVDPAWAAAVAMTESSLGLNQKSPTGCRGVFQMSAIAMKDLLQEMEKKDGDIIGVMQDDGVIKWTTIASGGGTTTLVLAGALSADAAAGKAVYIMRWKPMASLGA